MGGRLCIVGLNDDFVHGAGARIRYLRLRDELAEHGWSVALRTIASFVTKSTVFDDDVYLVSKVYDHRAVVLAHAARAAGRRVGVDLFDDYFSGGDPRLTPHRAWLRAMARHVDFALASTPAIAEAVRPLLVTPALEAVPVHLLNDPAVPIDAAALAARLEVKRARAVARRRLQVGWFGMGDNPYFDVGLHDLVGFAEALPALERDGWDICLRILTNDRALTADALARLARLPVPHKLELWSEAREDAVLATCDVAFLPVNAQPFSIVKSLNRAVTALAHGTQVLSVGHPLYERLDRFVYRDARDVVDDLLADRARLRPATLPALAAALTGVANAGVEGARLAGFLDAGTKVGAERAHRPMLAVLHGRRSDGGVHKMAQSQGALSVSTPFSRSRLHYHVGLDYRDGIGRVALLPRLEHRLPPAWRARLLPVAGADGRVSLEGALTAAELPPMPVALDPTKALRVHDLATYATVMRAAATLVEDMFDVDVTVSEAEPGLIHGEYVS